MLSPAPSKKSRSLSFSFLLLTIALIFLAWEHALPRIPALSHLAPKYSRQSPSSSTLDPYAPIRFARHNRSMPTCAASGKEATSFFMIFMGHSGSTAILTELRTHSRVLADVPPEPVDHQKVFNTTKALETVRELLERGKRQRRVIGFKVRPSHILKQPQQWRDLITEFDVRVIWQYRQNLLKATVAEYSYLVLNDRSVVEGFKHSVSKEERCKIGAGCSYRIDDMDFIHRNLRAKLRSQNAITSAVHAVAADTRCVREVPYEDYLYDRENTIRDLQRFLGLKYEKTSLKRFKATNDRLCDVVENWDELCRSFYGCLAWQHMLDDVPNKCFCRYTPGPATYCESGELK